MVLQVKNRSYFTSARPSVAASRALIVCPSASRPVALTKCAPRPISCALVFIISTKACSLPAIFSASATVASLALATTIAFIRFSTVWAVLTSRNTCVPPIDAACSLIVAVSCSDSLPLSTASNSSSIDIVFTMLAQGSCASASFSCITVPEFASISIKLFACGDMASAMCGHRRSQRNHHHKRYRQRHQSHLLHIHHPFCFCG